MPPDRAAHVEAGRPRFTADRGSRERILARFLAAAEEGDLPALTALLAEDAVLWSDGGGRAVAARRPIRGADRAARFMAASPAAGWPTPACACAPRR